MKQYITEQMLSCVKKNNIYPQDIDYNKYIFIHFGTIGISLIKLINKGEYIKHINYWQNTTAEELNAKFNELEWEKNI